jgi:deoxyribodipyrimidine photo-lyase
LKVLGIPMMAAEKPAEQILEQLRPSFEIVSVFAHDLVASEEKADAKRVTQWCRQADAKFLTKPDHNLIQPSDLPFSNCPDLFTTFRKQAEQNLKVRDCLAIPPAVQNPISINTAKVESPVGGRFLGGETEALTRLRHYLWDSDALRTYKETRNGMLQEDDSSKFSPWLAHGCLSPRQIYWEVRRYENERVSNDSTYWMIFELLWRDFFWLQLAKYGDRFFRSSGVQGLQLPWRKNHELFEAWKRGATGFPLVDASMRELNQTGYTSNRARQNVASFFCKNLGLDWRLGAAYYEEQLVDYDVASNWGNWMYQAGVGNDAREFRLFNLNKQADQYDPTGAYRKHYCPELRSLSPKMLLNIPPAQRQQFGYPTEIIDFESSARENRRAYERAIQKP